VLNECLRTDINRGTADDQKKVMRLNKNILVASTCKRTLAAGGAASLTDFDSETAWGAPQTTW